MPIGAMQSVSATGLNPTYAAPNATEQIVPNDRMFLHVKNTSGASITVTLVDPGLTPSGSAATNPTISVPAAGERMIFINPSLMSPVSGTIQVNFSATASVTAALIRN